MESNSSDWKSFTIQLTIKIKRKKLSKRLFSTYYMHVTGLNIVMMNAFFEAKNQDNGLTIG